ncbi:unnamed protein product, partial [Iphiclides podalirius]
MNQGNGRQPRMQLLCNGRRRVGVLACWRVGARAHVARRDVTARSRRVALTERNRSTGRAGAPPARGVERQSPLSPTVLLWIAVH